MAKTVVSDVIIPEIYNQYLVEMTATKSAFFRSGIIATNSTFNALIAGGGQTFNFPFWQDLTGNSEVLSDSASLSINNITTDKMVARRLERGKAWGANDLAGINAGSDPMRVIASRQSDWWARDMQTTTLNTLAGVFADNLANDSGDLISDIAIEDGDNATDANLIGSDAVLDAKQLLGDSSDKFRIICMHSVVKNRLEKLNLIDFEPTNTQNIGWGVYLGMTVVVDDGMPTAAGGTSGTKYTTYMFQPGTVGFGESYQELRTEIDRDILAGDDIMTTRRIFTFHPAGFEWLEASVAGNSPTNVELATAANWDRSFEKKNTGIVKLVTNG